jgi:hypothetical protein
MPRKRWRHDGPQHCSHGFEWTWEAFQGKAYPNPYNGNLASDQTEADHDRERWIEQRDGAQDRETRRAERHMAKRRREKTGRSW